MRPPGFGPFPQEWREVALVEGDQDAPLGRGERQRLGIGERAKLGVFVEREHVVTRRAQSIADAASRHVRIEQDAHASVLAVDLGDADERVELAEVLERPPVLGERLLDLVGVGLGVGEGEPE